MFCLEQKVIENGVDISLVKAEALFTHLETEPHFWAKQLIFYNNKLLKLLAIINQIVTKMRGKIY